MTDRTALIDMTADIVAAFVGNHVVRPSELPELIAAVYASLVDIGTPKAAEEQAPAPTPAVPIRKSVTDDYIVCLEDGKKFKSLRRHLATAFGMTPDDYRAKWGLARDYPMTAPGYAAKRSELAKVTGLGNSRRAVASGLMESAAPETVDDVMPLALDHGFDDAAGEPAAEPASKRRGRPRKAA